MTTNNGFEKNILLDLAKNWKYVSKTSDDYLMVWETKPSSVKVLRAFENEGYIAIDNLYRYGKPLFEQLETDRIYRIDYLFEDYRFKPSKTHLNATEKEKEL